MTPHVLRLYKEPARSLTRAKRPGSLLDLLLLQSISAAVAGDVPVCSNARFRRNGLAPLGRTRHGSVASRPAGTLKEMRGVGEIRGRVFGPEVRFTGPTTANKSANTGLYGVTRNAAIPVDCPANADFSPPTGTRLKIVVSRFESGSRHSSSFIHAPPMAGRPRAVAGSARVARPDPAGVTSHTFPAVLRGARRAAAGFRHGVAGRSPGGVDAAEIDRCAPLSCEDARLARLRAVGEDGVPVARLESSTAMEPNRGEDA